MDKTVKGAGIGAAASVPTAIAVTTAGFTGSGVAAGSVAAGVQAGIGNVAAGSTFAALQSIGATGVIAASLPFTVVAGAIGGLGYGIYKIFHH